MALVLFASAEAACSGTNYPGVALRQEIWRDDTGSGVNVADNSEQVYAKLLLIKRGASTAGTSTYKADGCTARAYVNGSLVYQATNVGYDFRQSSGRNATGTTQVLWEGWVAVPHNSDGTKTLSFSGEWDTPSGTILGDTSVSGSKALPKITAVPNVPTSVVATRVSDTQITLAWAQSNPGHGAPTQNEYRQRVNGGDWSAVTSISATTTVLVGAAANRKTEFQVRAKNAAGSSAWSSTSAPVYTTPAAPSGVVAAKDADQDIVITFTSNVGFAEHEHAVEHSADGGASWSSLGTVESGAGSFKHVAPSPSVAHLYRVRAATTSGTLTSAWVQSNTVQLLTAPAKPTVPALGPYVAAERDLDVLWVHNSLDTTPQSAYQISLSSDGGATWVDGAKASSVVSKYTIPADTYEPDDALQFRVRTWGQASSGGADGTGASPWSDPQAVVFKSAPVVSIVTPEDAATYGDAQLVVELGFTQAQGASFVQATVELIEDSVVLETVTSGTRAGIAFGTTLLNGHSYELSVVALDSNGVRSDVVLAEFAVEYTLPVAAELVVTYMREQGQTQLDVMIPEPGDGDTAAVAVTITRSIDGVAETLFAAHPIAEGLTSFIDPLPTLRGDNVYVVRTHSADGAIRDVTETVTTSEGMWAFLSTGPGWATTIGFRGNLRFGSVPSREQALVVAAGRMKPIALFGEQRGLEINGSAVLIAGDPSTPEDVEAFVRNASLVCYRDPSGRRVFGTLTASLPDRGQRRTEFEYKVVEAS